MNAFSSQNEKCLLFHVARKRDSRVQVPVWGSYSGGFLVKDQLP